MLSTKSNVHKQILPPPSSPPSTPPGLGFGVPNAHLFCPLSLCLLFFFDLHADILLKILQRMSAFNSLPWDRNMYLVITARFVPAQLMSIFMLDD